MSLSLNNHAKGYSLTLNEALTSAFLPPLSASVYATRHGDCAKLLEAEGKRAWGHRTIQVLEYIPLVGLLMGMIEKVCSLAYQRFFQEKAKEIASTDPVKPLETKTVVATEANPLTPPQESVVAQALTAETPPAQEANVPSIPWFSNAVAETVQTLTERTVDSLQPLTVQPAENGVVEPPAEEQANPKPVEKESTEGTQPLPPEHPPVLSDKAQTETGLPIAQTEPAEPNDY